jgi:micrococcal nuclease
MPSRWPWRAAVVVVVALLALGAEAGRKRRGGGRPTKGAPGAIELNGERTEVVWTDGDSLTIKSGLLKGTGTRLQGYNTLEAYGPVHRWGAWTAQELYQLALSSGAVAAARVWQCTTDGKRDGYKRLLLDCPELAVELARQGHALAYAVEGGEADPRVLAAQEDAKREGRGMWAKGVVAGVLTSVHALGEGGQKGDEAYNRVVDTRSGQALKRPHRQAYSTCEEVCETTEGDTSCLVYVPFERRYRSQPDCLLP